jgi:hypothetical protein
MADKSGGGAEQYARKRQNDWHLVRPLDSRASKRLDPLFVMSGAARADPACSSYSMRAAGRAVLSGSPHAAVQLAAARLPPYGGADARPTRPHEIVLILSTCLAHVHGQACVHCPPLAGCAEHEAAVRPAPACRGGGEWS